VSIRAIANRLGFNVAARSALETSNRKISLQDIDDFIGHVAVRRDAFSLEAVDIAPLDNNRSINDTLQFCSEAVEHHKGFSGFECDAEDSTVLVAVPGLRNGFLTSEFVHYLNSHADIKEAFFNALDEYEGDN
jgi:hypothetical protein